MGHVRGPKKVLEISERHDYPYGGVRAGPGCLDPAWCLKTRAVEPSYGQLWDHGHLI